MQYMVVIEKGETGYGAHVPDLPGSIAAGETREEVLELIKGAIEFHIEGLIEAGEPVPPPSSVSELISRRTTMSSRPLGTNASGPEVSNVASHGLWLLAGDKELFLSYEDFPWFKDVPIGKILNVQEPTPGHFYWPDLDVDLGAETIEQPDRFPLKAKRRITTPSVPTSRKARRGSGRALGL